MQTLRTLFMTIRVECISCGRTVIIRSICVTIGHIRFLWIGTIRCGGLWIGWIRWWWTHILLDRLEFKGVIEIGKIGKSYEKLALTTFSFSLTYDVIKSWRKKNASASTVTNMWSSNSVMKLHCTEGFSVADASGVETPCKCSVLKSSRKLGNANITSRLLLWSCNLLVAAFAGACWPLVLSIEFVFNSFSRSETGNRSTAAKLKKKTDFYSFFRAGLFRLWITINLTVGECIVKPFLQRFELWWENDIPAHSTHCCQRMRLIRWTICYAQSECQRLNHNHFAGFLNLFCFGGKIDARIA